MGMPAPATPARFDRPTPHQLRTVRSLGLGDESARCAAAGPDLFAYVEDEHSTLRLQIGPDGDVVGHTLLNRDVPG